MMKGIKDISKYKSINIFIDSESFSNCLEVSKIENYYGLEQVNIYEIYKWGRKSTILPVTTITYDEKDKVLGGTIEFKTSKWQKRHLIQSYENIKIISKWIFGSDKKCLCDMTEKVSISSELSRYSEGSLSLFLTQDNSIIENTHKIYPLITHLTITNNTTICEEILWLYLRSRGEYYLYRQDSMSYVVNYGLYYLLLFRSQIDFFLIDRQQLAITNEILFKWEAIFKTLDELGYLYYGAIDNDVSFDTKYYFYNYLVLICGIYDKLGIYIKRIKWLDCSAETQISLNPDSSYFKEFLSKIQDTELRETITNSKNILLLAYKLRNLIVHTEGLWLTIVNDDYITLKVSSEFRSKILDIDKEREKVNDNLYKNWLLKDKIIEYHIIPFLFAKFYTKESMALLNSLFDKLWNGSFIEGLSNDSDMLHQLKAVNESILWLDM